MQLERDYDVVKHWKSKEIYFKSLLLQLKSVKILCFAETFLKKDLSPFKLQNPKLPIHLISPKYPMKRLNTGNSYLSFSYFILLNLQILLFLFLLKTLSSLFSYYFLAFLLSKLILNPQNPRCPMLTWEFQIWIGFFPFSCINFIITRQDIII